MGQLLEQVAEGRQPETGMTVAEQLRQYMAVAELDRSTRQTYEGYIRRTILPALGPMELRKVRGPVLDMLYARLHRCGTSGSIGWSSLPPRRPLKIAEQLERPALKCPDLLHEQMALRRG